MRAKSDHKCNDILHPGVVDSGGSSEDTTYFTLSHLDKKCCFDVVSSGVPDADTELASSSNFLVVKATESAAGHPERSSSSVHRIADYAHTTEKTCTVKKLSTVLCTDKISSDHRQDKTTST